ncbi:MAG: flagellar biosynthetic protein FliR [Oscillospiraceae bacterium]|jgi:flagellar biosynthetic protein FliR|nr:flagellar biosynthetic protein FliR [Oscillospiraceae bacterium]
MDKLVDNYQLFLLILARMIGFVFMNPFFGKSNVFSLIRVGIAGILSFTVFFNFDVTENLSNGVLVFGLMFCLEFFWGFLLSFVVDLVLSAIIFGGELFDMQMGLSMSKFYDPSSGAELPTTGALIRVLFMITFFLTSSHVHLIDIIIKSYQALPIGKWPGLGAFSYILTLNKDVLTMGLKMAMPMIAAVSIMDIGIGVLMRTVPQLNVFVLNIYIKFVVGFLLLLKLSPSFIGFSHMLADKMFLGMENLLALAVKV